MYLHERVLADCAIPNLNGAPSVNLSEYDRLFLLARSFPTTQMYKSVDCVGVSVILLSRAQRVAGPALTHVSSDRCRSQRLWYQFAGKYTAPRGRIVEDLRVYIVGRDSQLL